MKHLILTAMLIVGSTPVTAQTFMEKFQPLLGNPFWDVNTYVIGFCMFRDNFYDTALTDGIQVDAEDPTMELYLREDFDFGIKALGVTVVGETPPVGPLNCPISE